MQDPAALSNEQLLQRLADRDKQLAASEDSVKQLQAKLDLKEREFLKLWQERFGAKSERYIADPDQLRIDFGDTPESADAAEGLHEAKAEAELKIPAHKRTRKGVKRTRKGVKYR